MKFVPKLNIVWLSLCDSVIYAVGHAENAYGGRGVRVTAASW